MKSETGVVQSVQAGLKNLATTRTQGFLEGFVRGGEKRILQLRKKAGRP